MKETTESQTSNKPLSPCLGNLCPSSYLQGRSNFRSLTTSPRCRYPLWPSRLRLRYRRNFHIATAKKVSDIEERSHRSKVRIQRKFLTVVSSRSGRHQEHRDQSWTCPNSIVFVQRSSHPWRLTYRCFCPFNGKIGWSPWIWEMPIFTSRLTRNHTQSSGLF